MLGLGVAAAGLVNPAFRSGPWLLGIVAGIAALDLALATAWLLRSGRGFTRSIPILSPVVSLLGWGILAVFTGGVESPFAAAIFFEIALAVVSMGPAGVLWVTGVGSLILVLGEALYRFAHGWQLLVLEVFFIGAIGGLGASIARRRFAGEAALRSQGEQLGQRLEALQRELEDERVISRVGENVARLAHGLKNAVHSLRGFVSLIEPQLEHGAGKNAALAGLRAAIDDLEKLARMTLDETTLDEPSASRRDDGLRTAVAPVIAAAHRELGTASPGVEWAVEVGDDAAALRVDLGEPTLLELLVILMRNAVEAMNGEGRGHLEFGRAGDFCRIRVGDEGAGFDAADLAKIFQPGFTTKPAGSGFGLFLARRIVEDHGGRLELGARPAGGALVTVELPCVPADRGESAGAASALGEVR